MHNLKPFYDKALFTDSFEQVMALTTGFKLNF